MQISRALVWDYRALVLQQAKLLMKYPLTSIQPLTSICLLKSVLILQGEGIKLRGKQMETKSQICVQQNHLNAEKILYFCNIVCQALVFFSYLLFYNRNQLLYAAKFHTSGFNNSVCNKEKRLTLKCLVHLSSQLQENQLGLPKKNPYSARNEYKSQNSSASNPCNLNSAGRVRAFRCNLPSLMFIIKKTWRRNRWLCALVIFECDLFVYEWL